MNKSKHRRLKKINKVKNSIINNNINEGYIYIIYTGFEGLYKIGMSIDVKKRLKHFKCCNPFVTEIFSCKVSHMKEVEHYLHLKWRGQRLLNKGSKEIFRLEEIHLEKIKNYLLSVSINI